MTDALLTPADLAEHLRITESRAMELRRANSWPCVMLSRKTVRFTTEQVEQIVALHSGAKVRPIQSVEGQTKASRKRRSA